MVLAHIFLAGFYSFVNSSFFPFLFSHSSLLMALVSCFVYPPGPFVSVFWLHDAHDRTIVALFFRNSMSWMVLRRFGV